MKFKTNILINMSSRIFSSCINFHSNYKNDQPPNHYLKAEIRSFVHNQGDLNMSSLHLLRHDTQR